MRGMATGSSCRHAVKAVRYTFAVVTIGYLFLLVVLFLASYLVASELADLLRSALVSALLPSVLFLAVAAAARFRRLAWMLMVPVIGFVLAYGAFLIPRGVGDAVATDGPPAFTFLTWNLQHERGDLDDIATTIRRADADVVALQELSVTAADHLSQALRDSYPHQVLHFSEDTVPEPVSSVVIRWSSRSTGAAATSCDSDTSAPSWRSGRPALPSTAFTRYPPSRWSTDFRPCHTLGNLRRCLPGLRTRTARWSFSVTST